jgi:anti-anti-sigma regulatory factor
MVAIAVGEELVPADIPALVERVRRRLGDEAGSMVVCDVGRLAVPDIGTVDALARLALAARRLGCSVILRGASPDLRDLLALAGMTRVIPCLALPVEVVGESELREEPGGVEEERDPGDPSP